MSDSVRPPFGAAGSHSTHSASGVPGHTPTGSQHDPQQVHYPPQGATAWTAAPTPEGQQRPGQPAPGRSSASTEVLAGLGLLLLIPVALLLIAAREVARCAFWCADER